MEQELISVIIRTKNEERWIDSCVKKIFDQKKVVFEIIIVDNFSSDNTINLVKKNFKDKNNIKILKIKKFLPGKAINLGVRHSKGKYICCLSAHCIPYDNLWLFNLKKNLKSKKIAAVYGRQVPLPYTSDLNKRDLLNTFGLDKKIQKKDSFFHNANSLFRKSVWNKLNFDNKATNIEDRIWAHKILKFGYHIVYEPNAKVYHFHGIHHDLENERCTKIVEIMENLDLSFKKKNYKKIDETKSSIIIPCKGKEIYFNKKSLIELTINQCLKNTLINNIIISTDDNLIFKKFLRNEKVISILRPKNLSYKYIDILTVANFSLKKLEKKNIYSDYIIIATPNFPFREKNSFNNLIKRIHSSNNDFIYYHIVEKGLIIKKNLIKKESIAENFVPNFFLKNQNLVSKFGYGMIFRPHVIRNLSIDMQKTSTLKISNHLNSVSINKNCSLKKFYAQD
jgi:rhamnosyltransferase